MTCIKGLNLKGQIHPSFHCDHQQKVSIKKSPFTKKDTTEIPQFLQSVNANSSKIKCINFDK